MSRQRGDERRTQREVVGGGVTRRAGPAVAVERFLREYSRALELQAEEAPLSLLVRDAHQPADDVLVRRARHPPDHDDHVELEAGEPPAIDACRERGGAGREGPDVDDVVAVRTRIERNRVTGPRRVVNEEHFVRCRRRQGRKALHVRHIDHGMRGVDDGRCGRFRLHRGQCGKGMERNRHLLRRRCAQEHAKRCHDRPVQVASLLHDTSSSDRPGDRLWFSPPSR